MRIFVFIIILLSIMSNTIVVAQDFAKSLYESHETYKEKTITKRRFGYQTLVSIIEKLKSVPLFEVSTGTKSTQGRDIFLVKFGKGKTKVLLWSQMHGDEATATMALADIFNFFQKKDKFDPLRKELLEKCTFYVVPMLNPDGAEAWTRYTALGIDMNRDALALVTPEGTLLKHLQQSLKPEFGFNLHDMERRYSAGETGNLATISFLATAFNKAQDINPVRKKSMQVIAGMNRALQQFIPNSVGKWPSDFEPRAFGDNIQKWGTTLILIESGGYKGDPEKQHIRKLNFVAILNGLESIANKTYQKEDIRTYDSLPVNHKSIFDIIIRNVTIKKSGAAFKSDIAINRYENPVTGKDYFTTRSSIEELGDLSIFFGTEEINGIDLELVTEKEVSRGMKADLQLVKNGVVIYTIKNGTIEK